jgi:type II secretory pathway predicted ATPase ExeA
MLQYFGFKEDPFGVNPDPRCLYLTRTHRQSLEALEFGFSSNRGFTAMIAPPGMGKTTLLFRFLEDIRDSSRAVFLFDLDSQCEPAEFVAHILRDLGITPARGSAKMHDQLSDAVIKENRAGRKFVIVIDEAQNLSDAVLERVRLLTNFETSRGKLIQIVLSGQSQLSDKLMQSSLAQLRQRISTVCHIESLSAEETLGYIDYRLKLAGYLSEPLFTAGAIKLIAEASHGTPRTINNLCFNALALCAKMNLRQVDAAMVAKVIAALQLVPQSNTQVTPVISVPIAAAVSVPVAAAVSESAEQPRKRREFEFGGLRLTPQPGDPGPVRPNDSAERPAEPRFWERTRLRLVHLATATVGSVMLWVPAAALILVLSFAGVLRLTEVLAPSSHDQTTDLTVPQPSTSDDPAATESTSPPDPGSPIANPDSAPAAAPKPQASASIPKPSPITVRPAAPIATPMHADASMPGHSEPAASSSGSNQKSLQNSATEPMPSAPAQPVVMAPQANVQPPSATSGAIPQQAPPAPVASAPKQVRSALNGNAPQPIAQDTAAPSVRPALPQP